MEVVKRDNSLVGFNWEKIKNAVFKAFQGSKYKNLEEIFEKLQKDLTVEFKKYSAKIEVEEIQDLIVLWLHQNSYHDVGIKFTKYRERRSIARGSTKEALTVINNYLNELDDMAVHENSSTMFSLQGLNHHIFSTLSSEYWLSLYSDEIVKAHNTGRMHIHDLSSISGYCCGWDLLDLIKKGFTGVPGKPSCGPAKHFATILNQANNFIFTLQGESAGAQAFSNFNTLIAPFIYYDNLSYKEVKQEIQSFVFNLNISTRVGFQAPFSNITLDLDPSKTHLAENWVWIAGEMKDKQYKDFVKEAEMVNMAFLEVMCEGDSDGAMLSYPIITINVTKDFPWESEFGDKLLEATAKYGNFYFANFINSEFAESDIRSMCCRLRINNKEIQNHISGLESKEYEKTHQKGGGFFGAEPKTGSIGVVTLGLPAIMYDAHSKTLVKTTEHDSLLELETWHKFLSDVKDYMNLAIESLNKKRKVIEDLAYRKKFYPYTRFYLADVKERTGEYFAQHFSTICINGFHEALLILGVNGGMTSPQGVEYAEELLKFMNEYSVELQKKHRILINIEQAPAESAGVKMCQKSKVDPLNNGYYTNSTWFPADTYVDLYDQIKIQGKLNEYYTGGSSLHTYTDSDLLPVYKELKNIILFAFTETKLPYMTISPVFSVCEKCGRIPGRYKVCPKCDSKNIETYSRIVGYYRAESQFNQGRKKEAEKRKFVNI